MLSLFSPALAFVAGVLSILSPCVLPLVPIVLGSAQSRHRWGALALGAGLTASFTVVGLFAATIGYSIGLDADFFRRVGGVTLLAVGLILVTPAFQRAVTSAISPMSARVASGLGGFDEHGLWGQAALGGLMGLVWSPCVGPTLGAAALLAAQGRDLVHVAVVMAAFGLGAAAPLVAIGMISAEGLRRWRERMRTAGESGKRLLGLALGVLGLLMISGLDRVLESRLIDLSPDWLTRLTTSL
jgi:cytochrome c-type biogenesis protein